MSLLGKKIGQFLDLLGFRRSRSQSSTPPPPQPPPGGSQFQTYDPGEKNVLDFVDDRSAQEFLYFGISIATPQSSNVASIQYMVDQKLLLVTFKKYSYLYEYTNVAVALAYDFLIAGSKGEWVWDNLRTLHNPYKFVSSPSGRVPNRMHDPATSKKSKRRTRGSIKRARQAERRMPRFSYHVSNYTFVHKKRQRMGLAKIRSMLQKGRR